MRTANPLPWQPPPVDLALPDNTVHVWRVMLDQPQTVVRQLSQILSDDERQRAGRFYFPYLGERFIVGRGALRTLVGCYTNTRSRQIRFSYQPNGKPYLDGNKLRFNLSHSHQLAIIAFSRDREIGIDIEHLRPLPDAEQVARHFFSASETAKLLSLPAGQREKAFFDCWTRKEAYIKALGDGLSHPLDQFDVSLLPGEPAQLLEVRTDPAETSRWTMSALTPAPDYVAALVVEGTGWNVSCFDWDKARVPPSPRQSTPV